jgi:hypothetical protein
VGGEDGSRAGFTGRKDIPIVLGFGSFEGHLTGACPVDFIVKMVQCAAGDRGFFTQTSILGRGIFGRWGAELVHNYQCFCKNSLYRRLLM